MSPSTYRIKCGGRVIEYEVRRSKRRKKTFQTTVKDGKVLVAAPAAANDRDIREVVRGQASWIIRKLSEAPPPPPSLKFIDGATFPYLGDTFPMMVKVSHVISPTLRFQGRRFLVDVPPGVDDWQREQGIGDALANWYGDHATKVLPELVGSWRSSFDLESQPPVLIGSQRSFWGSCSPRGHLRFSWRVMMLEPSLIDYIVVHELAHLRVPNHSPSFWELVSQVLPDVAQRRKRLRGAERELPL